MIYVLSGGGETGCTLVVTGVAGDNVTVSKDGKTYSETFKDDGTATFEGLKSGTWTVTMTGSSGTATRTVEISADYSLTITYFSATINVTYPKGSTCTATDGTTTLTAPDTSGTWMCIVPNAGTWTVTCTDGTDTTTEAVTISAKEQVETVTLGYETPITLTVSHSTNSPTISILIVKTADLVTITSGILSGTYDFAVMTNKNYDFTFEKKSYTLVCTVRQQTEPYFVGSILLDGETVSSFIGGTNNYQNSSYPWGFSQEGKI